MASPLAVTPQPATVAVAWLFQVAAQGKQQVYWHALRRAAQVQQGNVVVIGRGFIDSIAHNLVNLNALAGCAAQLMTADNHIQVAGVESHTGFIKSAMGSGQNPLAADQGGTAKLRIVSIFHIRLRNADHPRLYICGRFDTVHDGAGRVGEEDKQGNGEGDDADQAVDRADGCGLELHFNNPGCSLRAQLNDSFSLTRV